MESNNGMNRSTGMRCPACCAKAGEQHTTDCSIAATQPDRSEVSKFDIELLAKKIPLPETRYNGCGDGSEPLYTPDMVFAYAHQHIVAMAHARAPELNKALEHIAELERVIRAAPAAPVQHDASLGQRLHIRDVISRLQGCLNAAPGQDSATVSKLTIREAMAALATREAKADAAPVVPDTAARSLPGWERGIATVTMTGHQLHEALDFIAPDRNADEMDDELTFGIVQHADDNGKATTGLCCWNDDSDGVLPLNAEFVPPPATVSNTTAEASLGDDEIFQQARAALDAMLNKRGYGCGEGSDHQVEAHNEKANQAAQDAINLIDARRAPAVGMVAAPDRTRQALHDVIFPYAESIIKRGYTTAQQDERLDAIITTLDGWHQAAAPDLSVRDAAPVGNHPDDFAVHQFASVMKAKMADSRKKGRSGWDDPLLCSAEFLRRLLVKAVRKGDPVDVANFAMMLHARGAVTILPDLHADIDKQMAVVDADRHQRLERRLQQVPVEFDRRAGGDRRACKVKD